MPLLKAKLPQLLETPVAIIMMLSANKALQNAIIQADGVKGLLYAPQKGLVAVQSFTAGALKLYYIAAISLRVTMAATFLGKISITSQDRTLQASVAVYDLVRQGHNLLI